MPALLVCLQICSEHITDRTQWVEHSASWFMGDQMEIHVAIESFDNSRLKRCLASRDPSINCCNLNTSSCHHLTTVRHLLPKIMENVAPLHLAVIVDNVDAVKILLRPRSDMKAYVSINQRVKGCLLTALHLAILLNRREVISDLISAGSDIIGYKDANGLTAFELAVELNSPLTKVLYQEYYSRRAYKYSLLFLYLGTRVSENAVRHLLTLGDNLCFEVGGESILFYILRTYHHSNLIELVQFVLERVNLTDEEGKLIFNCDFGCGHRSHFPLIFQPRRSLYSRQERSSCISKRKGYNSLAVVLSFCRRPSASRIALLKLLISHGSNVHHLTRKYRSLLHVCTKSRLSSVDEAVFLIQEGVKVQYTDVRQAIKYGRLDFLGVFLQHSKPSHLKLKVNLPDALSMMVMKSVPANLMQRQCLTKEEAQSAFIKYFSVLIEDHGLDPSRREDLYPLPLLHLLIFKNKLFANFYLPVIQFIINLQAIDLMYEPRGSFGNAVTYAGSLKDWSLFNMLAELTMPSTTESEASDRRRLLRRRRMPSDSSTASSFSSQNFSRNGSTSSSASSLPLYEGDQFCVSDVDQIDGIDTTKTNRYGKCSTTARPEHATRVELCMNSKPSSPTDHSNYHRMKRQQESLQETSPEVQRKQWKRETKEWVNLIRSTTTSKSSSNIDTECSIALRSRASITACDSIYSLQAILEDDEEQEHETYSSKPSQELVNKEANHESITRRPSLSRTEEKTFTKNISKDQKDTQERSSEFLSHSVSLNMEGGDWRFKETLIELFVFGESCCQHSIGGLAFVLFSSLSVCQSIMLQVSCFSKDLPCVSRKLKFKDVFDILVTLKVKWKQQTCVVSQICYQQLDF